MSVMNANDFASTQQRSEVITVLGRDGMTIALREIYKRDAASFAQNGDYASALKAAHLTSEPQCKMPSRPPSFVYSVSSSSS